MIGRAGARVKIENFQVYVNDQAIAQPYLDMNLAKKPFSRYMPEIIIPKNKLFVMGDNRDNSNDSRFFQSINRADVIGKATRIIFGKDHRTGKAIK